MGEKQKCGKAGVLILWEMKTWQPKNHDEQAFGPSGKTR
jgi:hypothetical protein